MNYSIRWDLLQPVDVGGAIQRGFETGITRSALADLAQDPANEGALSRLAMYQPEAAMQMRDRARTETFRRDTRAAFDVNTGEVDPARMRTAYANAGDISGAMEFERSRAQTQHTQQSNDYERIRRLADLLDDSTDPASYARNREFAITQLHANPADIPEAYDPAWVAQQRHIVGVLGDRRQMTTLMQNVQAAGYDLNTPQGQAYFRQRLEAQTPRIVMVNGQPMMVGGDAGTDEAPPPPRSDAEMTGGPAPVAGPATFP